MKQFLRSYARARKSNCDQTKQLEDEVNDIKKRLWGLDERNFERRSQKLPGEAVEEYSSRGTKIETEFSE